MIATTQRVSIAEEADIVKARRLGKDMAKEIGFGSVDQIRIATGISELTRNVVRYAGKGLITISVIEIDERRGIEIVCEDHGPGIPNVEQVIESGYSTGRGLGLGLAGTKRLMDEFQIISVVGSGTTVITRKWL